ncbi:hypothetical protein DSUL_200010 [Desulfovibrionales bacterium]
MLERIELNILPIRLHESTSLINSQRAIFHPRTLELMFFILCELRLIDRIASIQSVWTGICRETAANVFIILL